MLTLTSSRDRTCSVFVNQSAMGGPVLASDCVYSPNTNSTDGETGPHVSFGDNNRCALFIDDSGPMLRSTCKFVFDPTAAVRENDHVMVLEGENGAECFLFVSESAEPPILSSNCTFEAIQPPPSLPPPSLPPPPLPLSLPLPLLPLPLSSLPTPRLWLPPLLPPRCRRSICRCPTEWTSGMALCHKPLLLALARVERVTHRGLALLLLPLMPPRCPIHSRALLELAVALLALL